MIRPLLTEIGIFLIPFAAYAVFLIATRAGLLAPTSWPAVVVVRLLIGALLLTIVSLALLTTYSGAPPNATYVPAHMENGQLVPGAYK
ncbi:hypothetical protein JQ557_09310 [Bradyrhizobium sp. U87765 SZCCT0131]|uniref:DUF6111 family protein n=1 Tax=unclassified Bradyrhizobium TaxID=2631580 RepID=UPI001BAAB116|nr:MULTISPECIES: DUF6111 family protein [unclassified Bradyrhizobium]MBR1218183.1 hypothetical protein [Bradyrhizobium sp. U87765 SZCCT0131]MBR1260871.1 hypothetical protein [Bradyrhizobium sp. U87765 SZCCT0134]MBR1303681.1 hypothetical protein [Bradyrhizobium sp. U87765 SZCCT0110]MBR1319287.1 hypothetical protein [Bradyrhizobium sp. U87765 SZCCT0109]MBR1347612.1 hypothetical protein [Bradyrhizobium sp. U87765 SZCCT0048]